MVGRLAPGQVEIERPALAVAADVDLSREAAARAPERLTPRRHVEVGKAYFGHIRQANRKDRRLAQHETGERW